MARLFTSLVNQASIQAATKELAPFGEVFGIKTDITNTMVESLG
jgi:hypothetical protein